MFFLISNVAYGHLKNEFARRKVRWTKSLLSREVGTRIDMAAPRDHQNGLMKRRNGRSKLFCAK